jgi:hypothetical protein
VAYPFRKNFWNNYPFTIAIAFILVLDSAFLVLPSDNWLNQFFDVLSLDGEIRYKYVIVGGIVVNSVLTYACEKLIATHLTRIADKKQAKNKAAKFEAEMKLLR